MLQRKAVPARHADSFPLPECMFRERIQNGGAGVGSLVSFQHRMEDPHKFRVRSVQWPSDVYTVKGTLSVFVPGGAVLNALCPVGSRGYRRRLSTSVTLRTVASDHELS